MNHETSLMMLQSGWIYAGLFLAVVLVFILSWVYGARVRRKISEDTVEISSIFITSIFSFFAILVAFQLTGSTHIHEAQRKLSVDEILSISAVVDSTDLLSPSDRAEVLKMLAQYVEQRDTFYFRPISASELEKKGYAQKELGMQLFRHAYALLPAYDGDRRIAVTNFLNRVQSMNTLFDQQYATIFMQTPRILWQALVGLMLIISAICGYKTGIEKGQQLWLTILFLIVVLFAIFICLNLGNPRVSVISLDLVDAQFPRLLQRIHALQ